MVEIKDGHVFRNGVEVYTLDIHEQDAVIKQLYPNDPTLLSVGETRKKQTSWSGTSAFDVDRLEVTTSESVDVSSTCEMADYVYRLGGTRLLTLYCHRFNFFGAAMDLGLTYGALMKWWQRKRTDLLAIGLTKELLISKMSTVSRDSN